MRDISGSPLLLQAQQAPVDYAPSVTVQFSYARSFSNTSETPVGALYDDNPGMNGSPARQDCVLKDDYIFTVYVAPTTGSMTIQKHNAVAGYVLNYGGANLICEPNTKPSIFNYDWPFSGSRLFELVYLTSASVLTSALIVVERLLDYSPEYDPSNCVYSVTDGPTMDYSMAALSLVSASDSGTRDEYLASFYRKEGGVGLDIIHIDDTTWTTIPWLYRRFVFPGKVVDDYDIPIYSCSVLFNGKIYNYVSNPDTGGINGVIYDPETGGWSNAFQAVPSDLSICRVVNAIIANDAIFMSVQYTRTDQFATSGSYNMLLKSVDGWTFSFSREVAFSSRCYRYFAMITSSNYLAVSDMDRIQLHPAYVFGLPDATDVAVHGNSKITSMQISPEACSLTLSDPKEELFDSNIINFGNRFKVFLGYKSGSGLPTGSTSASALEILYGTYRISQVQRNTADARRVINISGVSEGMYLINNMAFPFYTEIIGKSSIYDDFTQGNMYTAPNNYAEISGSIAIDLWNSIPYIGGSSFSASPLNLIDNGGVKSYSGSDFISFGVQLEDVMSHLGIDTRPKWKGEDVLVQVFGWSYTGSAGYIDYFIPVIQISCGSASGSPGRILDIMADTLESTYMYPLMPGALGSYPVEWRFSSGSFFPGDELRSLALLIQPENVPVSGSRFFGIERVRVLGFEARRLAEDPDTGWITLDGGSGIDVPGYGHPYIMLSQKPYQATNFDIDAEFVCDGGRVGLVGMATDCLNWVGGFNNVSGSTWEIVRCSDGYQTILATMASTSGSSFRMMFSFRDGKFWLKTADTDEDETLTWNTPLLTYEWTEADGLLDMSGSMIMHVGLFGEHNVPWFETPSFDINDSDDASATRSFVIGGGSGQTPQEDEISGITRTHTVMAKPFDLHHIPGIWEFPSSGSIIIDQSIYTYTGNLPLDAGAYGPFQYRNISDWEQSGDPSDFKGMAVEITWYQPGNDPLLYSGSPVGASSGHTWISRTVNWDPTIVTDGVTAYQHTRSRWFCNSAQAYSLNMSDRIYIGATLTGVQIISGSGSHAFNSKVYLYDGKTIHCNYFAASSGELPNSIANLVDYIVHTAGAETEYPGDYSGSAVAVDEDDGTITSGSFESLDITFTSPMLSAGSYVGIRTNLCPSLTSTGSTMLVALYKNLAGTNLYLDMSQDYPRHYLNRIKLATLYDPGLPHTIRIFVNRDLLLPTGFVSIYLDGSWMITYYLNDLSYPLFPVGIKTKLVTNKSGGDTVTNVVMRELYTWREAIYMEMETTGNSALSSIIQERPIEMLNTATGKLGFGYFQEPVSYDLSGSTVRSHNSIGQDNPQAASDAILVYLWMKGMQNQNYMERVGFATRQLQLPDLDDSEIDKNAFIILEHAYQRLTMHELVIRPDLRLERNDLFTCNYIRSSTETEVAVTGVVESADITLSEGVFTQTIRARDASE